MANKKNYSISLSDEAINKVDDLRSTDKLNTSRSDLIEQAIIAYSPDPEEMEEAIKRKIDQLMGRLADLKGKQSGGVESKVKLS